MAFLFDLARSFSTHPLTRSAPFKAWARFVSWQIRSRMHQEIIVPWLGGQSLAVRRGMTGATGNIYFGLHEFADMMLVLHLLREGDLFLDIGANVGSYTVLASGVCRATTWAFEPDPETVRDLKRNIAVNNLNALVTVFELALGSLDGVIPFTVGLGPANRVATAGEENIRTVNRQRLDALIGTRRPVMLKMDVEGHEEEVLRGAQALLASDCLKAVELETVTPVTNQMLISHQFARAYYEPFGRRLVREPTDVSSSNSLFVRDWQFLNM